MEVQISLNMGIKMNDRLDSVAQVRENLILVTKSMLAPWVRKRTKTFDIKDIYGDPALNSDLSANIEMIKAIREALVRLNCVPIKDTGDLVESFEPPVRVIDRDLLMS